MPLRAGLLRSFAEIQPDSHCACIGRFVIYQCEFLGLYDLCNRRAVNAARKFPAVVLECSYSVAQQRVGSYR